MRASLIVVLLSILSAVAVGNTFAQQTITLADVLSRTIDQAGPAPAKFTTPFVVVSLSPVGGGGCSLDLATNGMIYVIAGDEDEGGCNHLPGLHALVWGRIRHSGVATFLRQSNITNVASDYVDLVYQNGSKPKTAFYIITDSQAIDTDWGKTTVAAPALEPSLNAQVKVNSAAGMKSKAAEAAVAAGYNASADQMTQLIQEGNASRCLVVTNPSGADLYIDGKQAGKTPMTFVLYRHDDADRVITIKLSGFNTVEKKVSPNGNDVSVNVTLEPDVAH